MPYYLGIVRPTCFQASVGCERNLGTFVATLDTVGDIDDEYATPSPLFLSPRFVEHLIFLSLGLVAAGVTIISVPSSFD
jgi:hypothetical protein